jgi:hypothetical protein
MTRFIGIDGEGWTVNKGKPDEEHRYVLLAASTGQWAFNEKGLSTVRCFEFLLELPRKTVKCGFGFNYDVNMILRDVPMKQLIKLWKEGACKWKSYYIEWIPAKSLMIKSNGRAIKIYDVFGFFQASFIKSLKKWGLEVPSDMEQMKADRSQFDAAMKRLIIDYCLDECRLLAALMKDLERALLDTDLKVRNWIGAGAIASSLMQKHKVQEHHSYDDEWPDQKQAILTAYYGGRVELFRAGVFDHVWDYDVSSAYPSIAVGLPSLKDGDWSWRDQYDPSLEYCIWDCEWNLPDAFLCPFPVRLKGQIQYPRNGCGWYHAAEVRAAMSLTGGEIFIKGGWNFQPSSDDKPFSFIPTTYDYRRELKARNHAGEKVLKLGLNSIYGKLAQGAGYQDKPPMFQSFFWAGMITAGTRARVLETAMHAPDDLIMVATDGIFFKSDPHIPETGGLGGLELKTMEDMFVAQAGVYQATVEGDDGPETMGRSRGFFTREIDFDDLRKGFSDVGISYEGRYQSERFAGLGSCLCQGNPQKWRHWIASERSLGLHPNRKFVKDYSLDTIYELIPPIHNDVPVSETYTPKAGFGTLTDSELEGLLEYIQGTEQPLRSY